MNPVQLWAAIAHPLYKITTYTLTYLKLQLKAQKQLTLSLNLIMTSEKKTHVDSFFAVFFTRILLVSSLSYHTTSPYTKKIVQVHKNPLIPEPGIAYYTCLP